MPCEQTDGAEGDSHLDILGRVFQVEGSFGTKHLRWTTPSSCDEVQEGWCGRHTVSNGEASERGGQRLRGRDSIYGLVGFYGYVGFYSEFNGGNTEGF